MAYINGKKVLNFNAFIGGGSENENAPTIHIGTDVSCDPSVPIFSIWGNSGDYKLGDIYINTNEQSSYQVTGVEPIFIEDDEEVGGGSIVNPNPDEDLGGSYAYPFGYEIVDNRVYIIKDDRNYSLSGEVIIPEMIEGYPVVAINAWAFNGCTEITSITIPYGVTSISAAAFMGCTNLSVINIPSSVNNIGALAFSATADNLTIYYGGSYGQWFNATVESGQGGGLGLPDNATIVYDYEAENPDTPNEPESMVSYLTYSIENEEVMITGCTLGVMGSYAIPPTIEGYPVTSISNYALRDNSFNEIIIPDTVTNIGEWAFTNSVNLTNVVIGDGVASIGDYAFNYCTSLTSVTIGDNVTSIGVGTFNSCTNLTNITMGNNISTIGENAFSGCTSLTSITIPDSVTSLGQYAFYQCSNLSNVTLSKNITVIPDNIFDGCAITNIIIPESVTELQYGAFQNCPYLETVTISSNVHTIGSWCFAYCPSLSRVYIPNSVTNIYWGAFKETSANLTIYYEGTEEDCSFSYLFEEDNKTNYFSESVTVLFNQSIDEFNPTPAVFSRTARSFSEYDCLYTFTRISNVNFAIDPYYDRFSFNAQSGVAVAQAIAEEAKNPTVTQSVSGSHILINNASSNQRNFSVKATSDSLTDFSGVTVTRYGKNLANIYAGLRNDILKEDNGSFILTRGSSRFSNIMPLYVPQKTILKISATIEENTTGYNLGIQFIAKDGTNSYGDLNVTTGKSTFTVGAKDIVGFQLFLEAATTEGQYVKFKDFQIEISPTFTDYEPYIEQVVNVNADGTIYDLFPLSPNMVIVPSDESVVLECNYDVTLQTYIDSRFTELSKALLNS